MTQVSAEVMNCDIVDMTYPSADIERTPTNAPSFTRPLRSDMRLNANGCFEAMVHTMISKECLATGCPEL
jgi:hypothetical protein